MLLPKQLTNSLLTGLVGWLLFFSCGLCNTYRKKICFSFGLVAKLAYAWDLCAGVAELVYAGILSVPDRKIMQVRVLSPVI